MGYFMTQAVRDSNILLGILGVIEGIAAVLKLVFAGPDKK